MVWLTSTTAFPPTTKTNITITQVRFPFIFLGNTLSLDVDTPAHVEEVHMTIKQLHRSSTENPQLISFQLTRIDQICSAADMVFSSIGNPILD